ncbi:MAG: twin-arginine translocase subunit TatC [Chloroflexia bacterium]
MARLLRRGENPPETEELPRMSFLEHLEELRRRLIVCLMAIGAGTVVGFLLSERVVEWLLRLAEHVPGLSFQAIEVPEKFVASMRLALTTGVALALPVIIYQAWQFLRPGLYPKERRYLRIGLPLVTLFFAAGVAFSYFVALPAALRFLLRFGSEQVRTQPQLQPYLSFVSNLLFWSGVSFETPIFLFFLAKIGIVDWRKLSRWRKYAFLVICVLAAAITPTPDPVNMMLVALPLYALYECGILLARFA